MWFWLLWEPPLWCSNGQHVWLTLGKGTVTLWHTFRKKHGKQNRISDPLKIKGDCLTSKSGWTWKPAWQCVKELKDGVSGRPPSPLSGVSLLMPPTSKCLSKQVTLQDVIPRLAFGTPHLCHLALHLETSREKSVYYSIIDSTKFLPGSSVVALWWPGTPAGLQYGSCHSSTLYLFGNSTQAIALALPEDLGVDLVHFNSFLIMTSLPIHATGSTIIKYELSHFWRTGKRSDIWDIQYPCFMSNIIPW